MISNSRKWIKTSLEEQASLVYFQYKDLLLLHLPLFSYLNLLFFLLWIPYFQLFSSIPDTFLLLSFFHCQQSSSIRCRSTFLFLFVSSNFHTLGVFPYVISYLSFDFLAFSTFHSSIFVVFVILVFEVFHTLPHLN